MITRVHERLSFGDETTCTQTMDGSLAVVHACKEPCHRRAVGYKTRARSPIRILIIWCTSAATTYS